jgi:hypothetical protein
LFGDALRRQDKIDTPCFYRARGHLGLPDGIEPLGDGDAADIPYGAQRGGPSPS